MISLHLFCFTYIISKHCNISPKSDLENGFLVYRIFCLFCSCVWINNLWPTNRWRSLNKSQGVIINTKSDSEKRVIFWVSDFLHCHTVIWVQLCYLLHLLFVSLGEEFTVRLYYSSFSETKLFNVTPRKWTHLINCLGNNKQQKTKTWLANLHWKVSTFITFTLI